MIEKRESYFPSTNGVHQLHMIQWKPEGKVIAILQISHGMVEYINRYDRFATYLAKKGILVVGNDHLGHGKSVNSEEELGYFTSKDGSKIVVDDLHQLTRKMKQVYSDIPYFMLGHSMGSFFIRRYAMTYGEEVNGVIIMGTGAQPKPAIWMGNRLISFMKAFKGSTYRSSLMKKLSFGGYNKKFGSIRTENDWLTKDTNIVDQYMADKYCTFLFTLNGYQTLFDTFTFIQNKKHISQMPKNLPLLFVSGAEDPVGRNGKDVRKITELYKNAGIQSVEMKLYETDRHEILNELDYDCVYEDIYNWISRGIK